MESRLGFAETGFLFITDWFASVTKKRVLRYLKNPSHETFILNLDYGQY